jgi:hypothetical protein
MELTIHTRIICLNSLPQSGKYEDLIVIKDIKAKLDLTQEELEKYNFQTVIEGQRASYKWDESGDTFEFEFTKREHDLIAHGLRNRSEAGELTLEEMTAYEQFCIDGE